MRILFVTTNPFLPDHFCGQNRTIQELAARLAQLGHEPAVLCGSASPGGRGAVTAERIQGYRLFRSETPVESLSAVCVTLRPDVLVVYDGDHQALIEACGPLNVPLAVWLFQVEPHTFRDDTPDPERLHLASSRFVAGRARSLFGIDCGIVPPFFEQAKYRGDGPGNRVTFVNPVREKGIELCFALATRRPALPFTLVESWGLSAQWRRRCFERALGCGNIEWLPQGADMAALFQRTRVLLVPRFSEEGYCRLVTEAQLGGIPVLASDRGALAETVGPGGILLNVDAGVDAWLEQFDRMVTDDAHHRRLGEQARRHAERPEIAADAPLERLLDLLAAHVARTGGPRPRVAP